MYRNIKKSVVQHDDNYYLVSTVFIDYSRQFETMVFSCNKSGDVLDWGEKASRTYSNEMDAINGHNEVQYYWHP
jgi:hypothetical protein